MAKQIDQLGCFTVILAPLRLQFHQRISEGEAVHRGEHPDPSALPSMNGGPPHVLGDLARWRRLAV